MIHKILLVCWPESPGSTLGCGVSSFAVAAPSGALGVGGSGADVAVVPADLSCSFAGGVAGLSWAQSRVPPAVKLKIRATAIGPRRVLNFKVSPQVFILDARAGSPNDFHLEDWTRFYLDTWGAVSDAFRDALFS